MDNANHVVQFLSGMRCVSCNNEFINETIEVIKNEDDYTVVRIHCPKCDKRIGMAIMGISKEEYTCAATANNEKDSMNLPKDDSEPITYDDVIKAHHFFASLGSDWSKHLPYQQSDE